MSDTPNTSDVLTTTLTVTEGSIAVGNANGTTVTSSDGGATVTLVGTAAQIDNALATASYQGNSNFYGTDNLSVTTTDNINGNSNTVPVVANGKVYVATNKQLVIFGLKSQPKGTPLK